MTSHSTAVIAGVGTATESLGVIDLMTLAARRAVEDTGASALGAHLDVVMTPAGTWRSGDPGRIAAARCGSPGATSILAQLGVSQQGILNEGIRLIRDGEAGVVLIVGGEARRHERDEPETPVPGEPDLVLERPSDFVDPVEIDAGIAFPAVRSYALIERAYQHRHGRDQRAQRAQRGELWSSMSRVALENPDAAFPHERSATWLETTSDENPVLSTPYHRFHASQWTVDQAAALILVSPQAVEHFDVDPIRVVAPHVALESSLTIPLIRRPRLGEWPAMGLLGRAAEAHLGRPLDSIALRELYSCFPVAVSIQAEELGLPLTPAPSITGGMTFAGGPFNNFVFQSLAALVGRLRDDPGGMGLVTTVSGLLTKPGLSIWSTEPPDHGVLLDDLHAQAATLDEPLEVTTRPSGSIRIESSTTFRDAEGDRAVVIGRDERGKRTLVTISDRAAIAHFSEHSGIGEELAASW